MLTEEPILEAPVEKKVPLTLYVDGHQKVIGEVTLTISDGKAEIKAEVADPKIVTMLDEAEELLSFATYIPLDKRKKSK